MARAAARNGARLAGDEDRRKRRPTRAGELDPESRPDRLEHRPAELSGGQQQRVAIARALVSRPTVVFADEPTGNLDSATSGEILTLVRESVDSLGQTTVMVTHDANAAAIADRILFLADGRIVRDLGSSDAHEVLEVMNELAGTR
jgi:putative ABC transport system ATP-binding protein